MPAKRRLRFSPRSAKRVKRYSARRIRRSLSRTTMRATRVSQGPVAPRLITKLKYVETITLTTGGAGIPANQIFLLNSIFDPNSTGVGHQPYGHDQLALLYDRYRVFKCYWRIEAQNALAAQTTVYVVPINGTAIGISNPDAIMETPRCVHKAVGVAGSSNSAVFRGKISLPKLNGQTSTEYKSDDRFQAPFGSNPNEAMSLLIACFAPSGVTTVNLNVQLIYMVECFDPKQLPQS
jgi:hypothetical protein